VIIYVLLSSLVWFGVTLLSLGLLETEGFFYDLPNWQMPFGKFFILYTSAFIIYLFTIRKVPRAPINRKNIFIVICGAILFRLILLSSIPVHENDTYRYIWDGKVALVGINPYKYPPIQASIKPTLKELQPDFEKLKSLKEEDPKSYWRISFKDIPTIYPPLAQTVFAFAALIAPGSLLLIKLIFALFDTGVIFLLFMILKRLDQNPLYAVIYAWNPLVLKEFANSGHYDSLAIFCVTLAVYLLISKKYLFSGAVLSLGVLTKFYPLVIIPFLLVKKQYRAIFLSIIIICAGYLPFFLWGEINYTSIFSGFKTYTQEWVNNGFIYSLILIPVSSMSANPVILSKIICGFIYVIIWILTLRNNRPVIEKIFLAVTSLFILSPVGFPWYFCWVIPFLCIYRSSSLIILSYLLIFYYFIFTKDFGSFTAGSLKMGWLMVIQYVPFFLLLLMEWLINKVRTIKQGTITIPAKASLLN
jgi:alpha-1,6-mannosyltransferase